MSDPRETIACLKAGLEPYIKPREQVNYIRRILALQLGLAIGCGPAVQPLSLVDSQQELDASLELRGIYKEYVEAAQANVAACREFEEAVQASRFSAEPQPAPAFLNEPSSLSAEKSSLTAETLELLRLRQKQQRLLAVERSLNDLAQRPAASQTRLDVQLVPQGATALPSVPKELLDSFMMEQNTAQPNLKDHMSRLKRTLLRARLRLGDEHDALAEARARCRSKPEDMTNDARLEALMATRNKLIAWIETELNKTSINESDDAQEPMERQVQQLRKEQTTVAGRFGRVQDQYTEYVASRRQLLQAMARVVPQPLVLQPSPSPSNNKEHRADPSHSRRIHAVGSVNAVDSGCMDHFLTPYIKALLSVSRRQKTVMGQTSRLKAALAQPTDNACQTFDLLADESQLLPSFPMNNVSARRDSISNNLPDSAHLCALVKPWVFAADSAKIATLEAVAETIDGGQLALDACTASLDKAERLLALESETGRHGADEAAVHGGLAATGEKRINQMAELKVRKGDPWSRLHGNLGLGNAGSSVG